MHEHGRTQLRRPSKHGKQLRRVEGRLVHVRSDLDPRESQIGHAPFQLPDRDVRILKRYRSEPHETIGVIAAHAGDVIVQQPRQIQRVLGLRPIAEHDGNGGQDLSVHAVRVTLGNAHRRIPRVGLDRPKAFAVLEHVRAAGAVVFELDESAVSVPLTQVRPVGGQDVGMDVDPHAHGRSPRRGADESYQVSEGRASEVRAPANARSPTWRRGVR